MTTRLRALLSATLLMALPCLSAGCAAGGQTGEESGGHCQETSRALDLDTESPLGFSPRDVLGFAEGEHSTAFEWLPTPAVPYGPESGPGRLQLSVSSLGRARLVTREPNGTSDGTELLDCCPDSVQLDVQLTLRTEAGALDETVDAVLEAHAAGSASLLVLLSPPLRGTLTFDERALGDAVLEGVQLDVRLGPDDFSGMLHARFEETAAQNDPDASVSLSIRKLAEWGQASGPGYCVE